MHSTSGACQAHSLGCPLVFLRLRDCSAMRRALAKREETQDIKAIWHVAMRPGKRKALDKSSPMGAIMDKLEKTMASIRAKVEHPFRVIKRQFGHVKVRYRGLMKNTAQLHTLFALSNLWMARHRLLNRAQG
jgi:IS5 family transposase